MSISLTHRVTSWKHHRSMVQLVTLSQSHLTGDTFAPTLTAGTDVIFSNVPAGLTATITRGSATEATIAFTGTATAHTNAADIANFTAAFQSSAFVTTPASGVTASTKSDFTVDFGDATILYTGTGFSETAGNTGAVTGSIIATLSGATYAGTLTLGGNISVVGVPAGMTAVITRTSATVATLTLTGNATAHADINDVADIVFTFTDAAFTGVVAANVSGATSASSALGIDFADPVTGTITADTTTLTEVAANDGTITDLSTLTLAGDTFIGLARTLTAGTDYIVTGTPVGMTPVVTIVDSTHATVAFTGTAAAHQSANSASVQIVLLSTLFTSGFTAVGSTPFTVTTSFTNQPTLTFNTATFNEVTANDGSTTSVAVATLAGDTFNAGVTDGNPFTPTTHYTITNVPAGMTAVVTKTSATSAILTLTGFASANLTNPARCHRYHSSVY
jgi:hypothetical protein